MTDELLEKIRRLRNESLSIARIAHRLSIRQSVVCDALRSMGISSGSKVIVDRERLLGLWNQGLTLIEMGIALECSASTVATLVKEHRLPPRERINRQIPADPTPDEIAQRAAECRAKRPPQEERHDRVEIKTFAYDTNTRTFTGIDSWVA